MSTKFNQNRPGFVDDVTKTFGVFLGFTVPIAVHLQNATLSFIIQVSWKTFRLLYRKLIQDNVYQFLPNFYQNRLGFIEDMTKTFWCVFWFTV